MLEIKLLWLLNSFRAIFIYLQTHIFQCAENHAVAYSFYLTTTEKNITTCPVVNILKLMILANSLLHVEVVKII